MPAITYFKPAGIPLGQLQEARISVEEAEAIRLKDVEKLEQEECAQKMNISRTTFARVLTLARQKVADALLSGKAIRIEGGNFELTMRRFRCINGHQWDVPSEEVLAETARACPTCETPTVVPVMPWSPGRGRGGKGRRHRGGRGNW